VVSYWVQIDWVIPVKLKKRVSYAQFYFTLTSCWGFVKERCYQQRFRTWKVIFQISKRLEQQLCKHDIGLIGLMW
jgi:hypothetical protein